MGLHSYKGLGNSRLYKERAKNDSIPLQHHLKGRRADGFYRIKNMYICTPSQSQNKVASIEKRLI